MVEEPKPLELDQIKSILHGSYQNVMKASLHFYLLYSNGIIEKQATRWLQLL